MERGLRHLSLARAVMRLVAVLVAVVQLGVVVSPILDRDTGNSSITHVEELGVRQHWAHDAAECAGCALRHLTPAPSTPPVPLDVATAAAGPDDTRPPPFATGIHLAARFSRAPPMVG